MKNVYLLLAMFALATAVSLIYRAIMMHIAKKNIHGAAKNIGKNDRRIRYILGLAALIAAIILDWNPILLFIAGFNFFQAVFSWCGFYAAIGKNTCPIEL
jgi:hypothetical protein